MGRRKLAALDVPASDAEAIQTIEEIVTIERSVLEHQLRAEQEIDRIKAARDKAVAELQARRDGLIAAIKSWWEAGGAKRIAKGKRSAELAGAKLGVRKTPPRVKLRKTKLADVVAWLVGSRWIRAREFLRHPAPQLDKPAVIKAAQAEKKVRDTFAERGVEIEQVDEFFVDTELDEEAEREKIAAS
ncbi:MAG: hypothetical protein COW16_10330 [Sphingomonadales bacterium CG12_big_fil_rev_8_21_14_0_65_65_10]|nr:MAG: hypothetical protein COW16_10330 [Sphingomonadales bacterium CG12_big_fil_rev_8_21_14_0_65_65_10]